MTQHFHAFLFPVLAVVVAPPLHAESAVSVPLAGSLEVPAVNTAASGLLTLRILPDYSISGQINIQGMRATMAHIHEGVAGVNGPPIITLLKHGDNVFTIPPGTMLSEAQYATYLAGGLYVNVHSQDYPGGEIRAQLPRKSAYSAP